MRSPILAAEKALTAAFHALRSLPADLPADDKRRLTALYALVEDAAAGVGLCLESDMEAQRDAARAEVVRLRAEVDGLAQERTRAERDVLAVERLIPGDRWSEDGQVTTADIIAGLLKDAEARAGRAETAALLEAARRAQAERALADTLALPRPSVMTGAPSPDPDEIEAMITRGGEDCASHSKPPEKDLTRPTRKSRKGGQAPIAEVPREGEGAPA